MNITISEFCHPNSLCIVWSSKVGKALPLLESSREPMRVTQIALHLLPLQEQGGEGGVVGSVYSVITSKNNESVLSVTVCE